MVSYWPKLCRIVDGVEGPHNHKGAHVPRESFSYHVLRSYCNTLIALCIFFGIGLWNVVPAAFIYATVSRSVSSSFLYCIAASNRLEKTFS
ncbi:hypothetical protein PRIPAC_80149 [Pristionchus pacificus]|uniref:Uncharacterized protein n=1 Tax=Pristionchus pacificus TaxID=54126 RepID=A0A2A6CKT5_PRIPA|nr:hypothetical protein PRIPAC_80149 [Pristionchus pacificus]|eukprot:PDM78812.1 hypothetical protein PRIPAC_31391 [Pristionchus pacificus]